MIQTDGPGEAGSTSDHRHWLRELELAHFEPSSPGMPYWLPRGVVVLNVLLDHWRRAHERWGYQETSAPLLARDSLYSSSGHLEHFADNMFFCEAAPGDRMGLKPVNCPGTMVIFRCRQRSYRDLPMRLSSFDLLHRNERSGVLTGLLRVQAFHQDDAHIFLAREQAHEEVISLVSLAQRLYAGFGLKFRLRLGGAPSRHLGDDATWNRAESILAEALDSAVGRDRYIRVDGEGAFYGPKVDLLVDDSAGREWQLGTFQLDFEMPRRLECRYVAADGTERVPAVVHRALIGSFERFLAILLEHTDGHLPAFIAPVQVRLVPVSERHRAATASLAGQVSAEGLRVELLQSNERLASQIREAALRRIPFVGVIGDREEGGGTVSVRAGGQDLGSMDRAAFVAMLRARCQPPDV